MSFGRIPRKTILAATLMLAISAANASFLEQSGTPQASVAATAMTTYGVDVSTRIGLKTVIPAGWQLFVHKSVELPDSISWKVDESWISVLNHMAKSSDIAVLVDWDKKAVYFRTTAMAIQEQEKRQMIAQAAATPLPSFKAEPRTELVPAVAATVEANSPTLKTEKQPPTMADRVKAEFAKVDVPKVDAPKKDEPAVQVAAVVKDDAMKADAAKAESVAARLRAEAADTATTKAVNTVAVPDAQTKILTSNLTADLPTLLKASDASVASAAVASPTTHVAVDTGAAIAVASKESPAVQIVKPGRPTRTVSTHPEKVSKNTKIAETATVTGIKNASVTESGLKPNSETTPSLIKVATTGMATPAAAATSSIQPSPIVTTQASPTSVANALSGVPIEAPVAEGLSGATRPATKYTVAEAFNRESVSQVVKTAASQQGYTVSWEATDVKFPGPVTILGADMGEDMSLVLRALGGRRAPINIEVYRMSNVVRITNASGTANVAIQDRPYNGAIYEPVVAVPATPRLAETVMPVTAPIITANQSSQVVETIAPQYGTPVSKTAIVGGGVSVTKPAASLPKRVAPVAPVAVTPEPAREDTAVASIKKLEKAEPPVVQSQPAATVVTLRVAKGELLRGAIEGLLEPGWSLKWDLNGSKSINSDMEANTALEVSGESLFAVLNQVLPRLALSADIYKPSKLVVIRPADAALDK